MPVTVVDRLPLPNLKVYTAGSVLVLSVAVYQAISVTSDPGWRVNATERHEAGSEGAMDPATMMLEGLQPDTNATRNVTDQFVDVLTYMIQEPLCMWTVINMAYCTLALVGLALQRVVFGALRVAEAQRLRDKFWNYVFYKFIFVFGVINVQYMDEVLLWCSWFTVLGFLHLLAQLCKDRFDYLSSSPATTRWAHARLSALVCGILAAASGLLALAVQWGLPAGRDTFAFMAAECILVQLCAGHTAARYLLRMRDADASAPLAYYTHLVFDVARLSTELCHVVHMVVFSRLVVSMGSLVLLLQLRHLLARLRARLTRHTRALAANRHMTTNYPMASKEEVEKNQDNCAICWEPMKEARKLPCSHLFHNSCLCQWVQQDASCPTCRRALEAALTIHHTPSPNQLFHFDGSRYVSWLPSFSVEVTRVRPAPLPPARIEAMAEQVQQMFPHVPPSVVAADLARTRSADHTVDNILEGRLYPPPPQILSSLEEVAQVAIATDISASEHVLRPARQSAPHRDQATATTATAPIATTYQQSEVGQSSSKFAMEASEREAMLQRRKEQLIEEARKKYLDKMAATPHAHNS